ncbi:uncharacterized protein CELE_F15B9.6 [Caenorhabditis elegans]|uniref:Uncharacterized protein n=1 Tax=Caenorhabditis elegans TaxID=6239 RepID=Q19481_CAEEL|nr:Uncharacterized protein CELE_F15B9.6 [Caenorhabditis elegans]CAB01424.2 Uncharacterized protein CELE_F15B9.6 [Caenorhabditis elegans]|eukprot:NP_506255.2 Uncharacterized protein CELE_F15B9.6 [Caenorhabditis elegans]
MPAIKMKCLLYFIVILIIQANVPGSVQDSPEAYNILEPNLGGCPRTSDRIKFCSAKFNSSIRNKVSPLTCAHQWCSCAMEIPEGEEHCKDHVQSACLKLKSDAKEGKIILAKPKFDISMNMKQTLRELENNCTVQIMEGDDNLRVEQLFKLTLSNRCINEHSQQLEQALIEEDTNTSVSFDIPFDWFRCGWEHGAIGIVFNRKWVSESCGEHSAEINNCCAKHYNCYMNQRGYNLCDKTARECHKSVVLSSHQESCKAFSEKLLKNRVDEEIYKTIGTKEVETQFVTFDGNLHAAMKPMGTLNSILSATVHKIQPHPVINATLRHLFDNDVYKYGWSNRIEIDSCILRFEHCKTLDKIDYCLIQLRGCILSIDNEDADFKSTTKTIYATIDELIKIPEESWWSTILPVIAIIISIFVCFCDIFRCVKFLKKKIWRTEHQALSPPNGQAENNADGENNE